MSGASEPYVKLMRRFFASPIWKTAPEAWTRVYLGCLERASYKPGTWHSNIPVEVGDFITSRRNLAASCRASEKEVRSALKALQAAGFIVVTPVAGKWTRITVTDLFARRARVEPISGPAKGQVEGQVVRASSAIKSTTLGCDADSEGQVEGQQRARLGANRGPVLKKEKTEKEKEEEERVRVAEPLSPPPPPADAVEVFIEARYPEFAQAYPGGGGMPRTISEAVRAYRADGGGRSVEEWWRETVIPGVERYQKAVDREVTTVRDSPFFFMDRLYLKQWAGDWSSRVTSSRFDPASLEDDDEKERLIKAGAAEPVTVKRPAATPPTMPPTPKPPSCRTCGGKGSIEPDIPAEFLDSDRTSDQIWHWQQEHRSPCPSCNAGASIDRTNNNSAPRKTRNDLVPIRETLSPIN